MVAKHKTSISVICPFYKCEERQVIYCEGLSDGTAIHLAFAYPPKLKEYKASYCEDCFDECRIAKMLTQKWEEEEENASK